MIKIPKLILSTLLIGTTISSIAIADNVKIGIAAEPYPPFATPDAAGNWSGWEIDIIGAICAAAEIDCKITPVAWDGIIPSLTGKKVDAIMASLSITEERMKTIDFSEPYYNTPAVIVASKGMDIDASPEALVGKILGIQGATTHQAYANEYFAENSELKFYQTQDAANQDLVAGRVDAIQADSIAMSAFIESDAGACCEIKGTVANDASILGKGVGAGVRQDDSQLKDTLNAAIAKVIEDGTHAEITSRYFSTSILSE